MPVSFLDHVRLMARYNAWMNEKAYAAAAALTPAQLVEDRGAYFRSVLGTLNHLMVADVTWLQRLATHPAARPALDDVAQLPTPRALDEILFTDLEPMRRRRTMLDAATISFAEALDEQGLDVVLSYRRISGEPMRLPLAAVLSHLFNHQTHHRGQLSTLLTQMGVDIGVTDIVAFVPAAD